MPTIDFTVERLGGAEQYIERLDSVIQTKLNASLSVIRDDISANAPRKTGGLAESFYTIPVTGGNLVWEGYIVSSKPDQARAHEYGSGLHGPARDKYPIYPRNARFLKFEKEGKTLILPMVMHPGVHAQHYIDRVLRKWRPVLIREFGDAIQLAAVHHWGTY